jgi:hypothetical protein
MTAPFPTCEFTQLEFVQILSFKAPRQTQSFHTVATAPGSAVEWQRQDSILCDISFIGESHLVMNQIPASSVLQGALTPRPLRATQLRNRER